MIYSITVKPLDKNGAMGFFNHSDGKTEKADEILVIANDGNKQNIKMIFDRDELIKAMAKILA